MDFKPVREFLTRCFVAGETIALLLRREEGARVIQRIVTLETVLAYRYLAWLAHQNADGANVYVAANPLTAGSRRRTKESIAAVRHLYLDLDVDGSARLNALLVSACVPVPNVVLNTSPDKYQVLWRVAGYDFETQESTLKQSAIAFGGDPACTDCNRVLRIPGFLNQKYRPAYVVTAEYPCDSVWTPKDFQLPVEGSIDMLILQPSSRRKGAGKQSNSESDWAWVSHELSHGVDALTLTRELASRRTDKPNPLYYAQRTVDVASARLWLIESVPLDEVIARLQDRRRFELPLQLCVARAREIGMTAQRMIAPRKRA